MLQIAEQALNHEHHISGIALRLAGDGWEPWLPPPGHALRNDSSALRIQSLALDCDNQKRLLQKQLEKPGDDLFVAAYKV